MRDASRPLGRLPAEGEGAVVAVRPDDKTVLVVYAFGICGAAASQPPPKVVATSRGSEITVEIRQEPSSGSKVCADVFVTKLIDIVFGERVAGRRLTVAVASS